MKKDERSEATRDRIIAAALGRFMGQGYDVTSIADVCAAAEVSKGAFYHHFPGEQAVFVMLLERWVVELDATIRSPAESRVPVPQQLESLSGLIGWVSELGSGQVPVFLKLWRQAANDRARAAVCDRVGRTAGECGGAGDRTVARRAGVEVSAWNEAI